MSEQRIVSALRYRFFFLCLLQQAGLSEKSSEKTQIILTKRTNENNKRFKLSKLDIATF